MRLAMVATSHKPGFLWGFTMGDRCYVEITVRKRDKESWEALGYADEYHAETDADHIVLIDEERNYGVSDTTDDIVDGCPMYGYHEEGGNYPAMLFAFDGESFLSHECNSNKMPIVECGPDGPAQDHVDLAKEFLAFYGRVEKMVCGNESPTIAE